LQRTNVRNNNNSSSSSSSSSTTFVVYDQHLQSFNVRMPVWARNPSKAWAERYLLLVCPVAVGFLLGAVVATGWYQRLDALGYALVSLAMALVCVLPPVLFPGTPDRTLPWQERFIFKANVWNGVFGFIGNYLWTHYFYRLLGAEYTFPSWRLNDVPIPCYLATQPYFCMYHTLETLVLRLGSQRWTRLQRVLVVLVLAYGTAFAETVTIAAFPHYRFRDWRRMVWIGSAFYGLYFVVSFPMYYRIDEDEVPAVRFDEYRRPAQGKKRPASATRWTLSQVALDALAAAMLVTLLLEAWRLAIGGIHEDIYADAGAGANPWMLARV
jgi:cycloeucalenol cycloisomerase